MTRAKKLERLLNGVTLNDIKLTQIPHDILSKFMNNCYDPFTDCESLEKLSQTGKLFYNPEDCEDGEDDFNFLERVYVLLPKPKHIDAALDQISKVLEDLTADETEITYNKDYIAISFWWD